jgi:hypothetical protein
MKPGRANWMMGEIFARWPAHFCRVAGAAAGNCAGEAEKSAGFQAFCGGPGFFPLWHDRC